MSKHLIRAAAILAVAMPLAGCLSFSSSPTPPPATVVVTQPDSSPATVVKPAY